MKILYKHRGDIDYVIGQSEQGKAECAKEQQAGADPEGRFLYKVHQLRQLEQFNKIVDAGHNGQ